VVTIEGLLAMRTPAQVVALFAAVKALEDVDPHGLSACLLHRFLLQRRVVVRDVGRGRGVVGGVRAGTGTGVGARRSVGMLRGGAIGRFIVVFLRFALFSLHGADVCGILLRLRIGLEELALFLVAGPPRDELA